ncbi:hypothetical protein Dimus_005816 [Dionaea muscipula]
MLLIIFGLIPPHARPQLVHCCGFCSVLAGKRGLGIGLMHGHAKLSLHGLSPSMAVIGLHGCSTSMACARPTAELDCKAIWQELKLCTELSSAKPVLSLGLFTMAVSSVFRLYGRVRPFGHAWARPFGV